MKKLLLAAGLVMAVLGGVQAQVRVELVFDQEQFLRNESLPVKVRISNSSGQVLHLGTEPGWIVFGIEDQAGHAVRQIAPIPSTQSFEVGSAQVAKLQMDLMPYYEMDTVGRYTVTVAIRVPQLNQTFSSKPASFDIIGGVTLWERDFGVPSAGVPEVRKYALLQGTFLKQLRLYLRLTDGEERRVFRVLPLGTLVSFSKPEAQLDKSCQLHVLFQNGARSFLYHVLAPDGCVILRQSYDYTDTRPMIRSDQDGSVFVQGGQRRVLKTDLPPSPELTEPPPPPPLVEPTNAAVPSSKKSKKSTQ